MLPVMFTPSTTFDAKPGVRAEIPAPVALLLGALLDSDNGASPLPAEVPLATVAGSEKDMFAHLEAEMVADSLAQAQASRRELTRVMMFELLATAGARGIDVVLPTEVGQELLEWLNRMYVTLRTRELALASEAPQVGQGQSAAWVLGLDDDGASGDGLPAMNLPTVLLAVLVEELQGVLLELPE
jgi:hypothetical protein